MSEFNPIINVRGAKVALGPFLPEHHQIYLGYLQDPEIATLGQGTFDMRLPFLVTPSESVAPKNQVIFTIFELEGLTMIGESLLMEIDHRHGTAMFGITIGRKEYWGKGYGTEAAKLVLDYGFRFLNLHNISLITTSFNLRGQAAYKKVGFKEIGRHRGAVLLNGQRYDDIYMDCLVTEFEAPVPGWFSL